MSKKTKRRKRYQVPRSKVRRNRVQVFVTDNTYEQLCTLADMEETSMSNMVAILIERTIKNEVQ